jgi:hypothetical protein
MKTLFLLFAAQCMTLPLATAQTAAPKSESVMSTDELAIRQTG